MTAQILDGKTLANTIQQSIKQEILAKKTLKPYPPHLSVIFVGNDPASLIYINKKQEACHEAEIESTRHHLPENTTQETLLKLINQLNLDEKVHGILVQLPLPPQIDTSSILEAISPQKDVDGFHPYHLGRLAQGNPSLRPCTPYGIMRLLDENNIILKGKHAVIVGASNIVGKPMALELINAGATVTVCHQYTENLKQHIEKAEILISAIGKLNIINTEWIQSGSIIIDVGMNRTNDQVVVGDIDFDTAKEKASYITPVPGGVGPMTVAMLLKNTLLAW